MSIHGKVVAGNSELVVPHSTAEPPHMGRWWLGSNESEMNKKQAEFLISKLFTPDCCMDCFSVLLCCHYYQKVPRPLCSLLDMEEVLGGGQLPEM